MAKRPRDRFQLFIFHPTLHRIPGQEQPSTFNLQPSTFNLQPSTFNLQPSTFNPLTLAKGHAIAFNLQLLFLHPSTVTLSSDNESSNHIPEAILG
ncbi:MAG: hypothetical protein F6K50_23300 [Moorea sp. SIO3I7]|uniref:hypothetical protein n=1 Tax=unclassified Moorena TaxID=2683338 RepID=UPI0013BF2231|nr:MULTISPECIES: hypothetical protein [unclassified Moorena]NEN98333.1 hypothetical protein [Moorena sp. SIO3I7]NEO04713.1 hypothetical protein [Moorena sp. SIO3I8]NEO10886.1 hypothetical protein [Moorena sp. SIO3E8]NEP97423.1 hypothetical protein [Moorena sp. SIO3F7]